MSTAPTIATNFALDYDAAAERHRQHYLAALSLLDNIHLLFSVLDGLVKVEESYPGEHVDDTRALADSLVPWLAEQGYALAIPTYDLDPVGYFVAWFNLIQKLQPHLMHYISPVGLSVLAVEATKH